MRAARRSAVPDRAASRIRPMIATAARRTVNARAERTGAASRRRAWPATAGVRTTSALPTRLVDRGRLALAVGRPRTTARTLVTLGAIVSWTRTADRAVTARPRRRAATKDSSGFRVARITGVAGGRRSGTRWR